MRATWRALGFSVVFGEVGCVRTKHVNLSRETLTQKAKKLNNIRALVDLWRALFGSSERRARPFVMSWRFSSRRGASGDRKSVGPPLESHRNGTLSRWSAPPGRLFPPEPSSGCGTIRRDAHTPATPKMSIHPPPFSRRVPSNVSARWSNERQKETLAPRRTSRARRELVAVVTATRWSAACLERHSGTPRALVQVERLARTEVHRHGSSIPMQPTPRPARSRRGPRRAEERCVKIRTWPRPRKMSSLPPPPFFRAGSHPTSLRGSQ